jgi:hypothetical protein
MPHGAGWYVVAVENGSPRELTTAEDKIVEAVPLWAVKLNLSASRVP